MNKLLDAALAYAALGIPVFPCDPVSKIPLPTRDKDSSGKKIQGTGGHKKATTDPEMIRRWWRARPNAAIGMPTGPTSGIDVLDLDCKRGKNGFAAVPDWERLSPVIVRTPSGGAHLYFKSTGSIRNSTSRIAIGVDTRGVEGYVLLPPSPGYQFLKGAII